MTTILAVEHIVTIEEIVTDILKTDNQIIQLENEVANLETELTYKTHVLRNRYYDARCLYRSALEKIIENKNKEDA